MFFGVVGTDLVEAEDCAGAVVEFVIVDFVGGQGGVEGDFDVGGEGDVLHFGGDQFTLALVEDGVLSEYCWFKITGLGRSTDIVVKI